MVSNLCLKTIAYTWGQTHHLKFVRINLEYGKRELAIKTSSL